HGYVWWLGGVWVVVLGAMLRLATLRRSVRLAHRRRFCEASLTDGWVHFSIFSMAVSISETRNGLPCTLQNASAGHRDVTRRSQQSCPVLSSGTRIFLNRLRSASVFLGIGLRYRKWAWATLSPLRWARCTAVVMLP